MVAWNSGLKLSLPRLWRSFLRIRWKGKGKAKEVPSHQSQQQDVIITGAVSRSESGSLADNLPDELLQRIFEKLIGSSNDMKQCMQVSKKWRSIMKLVVRSVYLKDDLIPRLERVAQQLQEFENLSSLRIKISNGNGRPWSEFFRIIGATCKRLKQLTLLSQSPVLLPDDVSSMLSNMGGLEKVLLNGDIHFTTPAHNVTTPLTALTSLTIIDNPSLTQLPKLSEVAPSLRKLELRHCANFQCSPDLSGLPSLSLFCMEGCSLVPDLPSLSAAMSLEVLEIVDCTSIVSLPSVAQLSSLVALKLRGCSSLHDVPGLDKLSPEMERLMVYDCPELPQIPTAFIRRLRRLKELALGHLDDDNYARNVATEPGPRASSGTLDGLDSLQMFALDSNQETIPPLGRLPSLLYLRYRLLRAVELPQITGPVPPVFSAMLFGCSYLQSIDPLACFATLEQLTLMGCYSLRSLPCLGDFFPFLRDIVVCDCPLLESLPHLSGLSRLSLLRLEGNERLKCIPNLVGLPRLHSVSLRGCSMLQELPLLTGLPMLRTLNLSDCTQLRTLYPTSQADGPNSAPPPFVGLTALEELSLQRCTILVDIPPLKDASEALVIKVEGCTSLRQKGRVLAGSRARLDWGKGKSVTGGVVTARENVGSQQRGRADAACSSSAAVLSRT